MRKLTSIVLALAATFSTLPIGSSMAQDTRNESTASLKGTFRFTAVKSCTSNVVSSPLHFYFAGTIDYDGHGTARLTQQGTLVLPDPSLTSFEETAELTYAMKPNGSFTQEGTFRAVDQSYTLTSAKMIGHMDPHGSVLIFHAASPAEKETVKTPGGGILEYLCGASGTAVRIR